MKWPFEMAGWLRSSVPAVLSQSCVAAAISRILLPRYRLFLCHFSSAAVFNFAYLFLHIFAIFTEKSAVTADSPVRSQEPGKQKQRTDSHMEKAPNCTILAALQR